MAELARLGLYVDSSGVVRATKELNKLEREGKQAERQSDKLKRSFGGLKTAALAVGSAIAAIGVTRLVGNVADAGLALDAMNSSLRVATGSAEGAAREMQFLREVSEQLGLDIRSSGDAFASLAAAARGTALEGQGARDIFVAVSEAMTALGRGAEETEGALRAIEQMISKGNVSAEELRGQLGERLPGAFQIAARAAGVTTQELDKMLRNGEVLAEDLLPKMADELRETFSAEAERRANGLQAEINRFKTAVFELMASGNMDGMANAVRDFTEVIKDPTFQQGFAALVGGLIKIAEIAGKAASGFGTVGTMIGETAARLMGYETLVDQILSKEDELESARNAADNARTQVARRNAQERVKAIESELSALRRLHEMSVEQVGMTSSSASSAPAISTATTVSPASPTSPAKAIEEGLKEAEPIDTSSLMWDWSPVRDEFKDELEAGMIDSQAIMDEWAPKLFEEFPEEAASTADEMTKFMERAAENMQDAMANGFFDIMQGNFDNLGDNFKATIDRMVSDMLASQLMNFLAPESMGGKGGWFSSAAGSAGNSFFGGLADLFSFDGGGYTGNGARAGGMDGKGGYLAMLHPQETVVDHTKGQSTSNITFSPVYNISSSNPQQVRQTVDQANKQMMRQLQHAQRNM